MLIVLVDHDVFRVVPLAERTGKAVYDVRGIWPDQTPDRTAAAAPAELRRASYNLSLPRRDRQAIPRRDD